MSHDSIQGCVRPSVGWLVGRLVGWSVGWLISCPVGRSITLLSADRDKTASGCVYKLVLYNLIKNVKYANIDFCKFILESDFHRILIKFPASLLLLHSLTLYVKPVNSPTVEQRHFCDSQAPNSASLRFRERKRLISFSCIKIESKTKN